MKWQRWASIFNWILFWGPGEEEGEQRPPESSQTTRQISASPRGYSNSWGRWWVFILSNNQKHWEHFLKRPTIPLVSAAEEPEHANRQRGPSEAGSKTWAPLVSPGRNSSSHQEQKSGEVIVTQQTWTPAVRVSVSSDLHKSAAVGEHDEIFYQRNAGNAKHLVLHFLGKAGDLHFL